MMDEMDLMDKMDSHRDTGAPPVMRTTVRPAFLSFRVNPSRWPHHRRDGRFARIRRSGFTLLEIMIVIVVIGIIAAIAVPNMAGPRERTALKTGVKDIATAGLLARQMAIVQGGETHLVLDTESGTWQLDLSPPEEDGKSRHSRRNRTERVEGTTIDEVLHDLPQRITYAKLQVDGKQVEEKEDQRVTFFPTGGCSGMAIQLKNTRDKTLTVEFDKATGRPEIYDGEPKSLAAKLKEAGLNPADYGLIDDTTAVATGPVPGEGFSRTAGWSSDERVQAYTDAADRMMERARARHAATQDGGLGAYYSEASRWGN